MKSLFSVLILIVMTTSCTRPCHNYNVVGPCEFVTDSYRIRQGKQAIQEMTGIDPGEMPFDALDDVPNVINEGDVFYIVLHHPKRADLVKTYEYLSDRVGGFKVTNGEVYLPDIGSVAITGLTLNQAQEKIQKKLRENIEDIEVFISYRDRLRYRVTLMGMVGTSHVPIDGHMRLFDVLAQARVPGNANFFMSYLERDGNLVPIDMYKLVHEGDMTQNIVMKGGDKLFIASPTDAMVTVLGEVNNPTQVPVIRGSISLLDALAAAKGIPYTGDRCRIQVIRGDLQCPKIYVLSWNHVVNLPNDSLLLMPGDTVYVTEKPISQWNRFISQLLPTCNGFQAFNGVYRVFVD